MSSVDKILEVGKGYWYAALGRVPKLKRKKRRFEIREPLSAVGHVYDLGSGEIRPNREGGCCGLFVSDWVSCPLLLALFPDTTSLHRPISPAHLPLFCILLPRSLPQAPAIPPPMATHGPINGVKVSRAYFPPLNPPTNLICIHVLLSRIQLPVLIATNRFTSLLFAITTPAIDDPHKVVKVIASEGKSGDQLDLTYTNCKVVGNGSFGVVFQAKLVGAPKEGEDIAIKKVLQDKRFKVCFPGLPLLPRTQSNRIGNSK